MYVSRDGELDDDLHGQDNEDPDVPRQRLHYSHSLDAPFYVLRLRERMKYTAFHDIIYVHTSLATSRCLHPQFYVLRHHALDTPLVYSSPMLFSCVVSSLLNACHDGLQIRHNIQTDE